MLIDALTLTTLRHRAVAVLGVSYLTPAIALALVNRPEELVLAFDNDPAGRCTQDYLADLLQRHARSFSNWPVPSGHDVNSALRRQVPEFNHGRSR